MIKALISLEANLESNLLPENNLFVNWSTISGRKTSQIKIKYHFKLKEQQRNSWNQGCTDQSRSEKHLISDF